MKNCQCENAQHFGGTLHEYDATPATEIVKTIYGDFRLCSTCQDLCNNTVTGVSQLPIPEEA
jgi:hypothetical protein